MATTYIELHAHSNFSFLEGASHVEELVAVWLSGRSHAVEAALNTWRIDDEWWRERAVSRAYYSLLLEDGRTVTVYCDMVLGRWARQTYSSKRRGDTDP